jgi:hypothetical protein
MAYGGRKTAPRRSPDGDAQRVGKAVWARARMRAVLTVTAVLEAATGLGILALPSVVSSLILGSPFDSVAALVIARIAGVALLALGVACWMARQDEGAHAVRGLVGAMALYNVGVLALLAHAALVWGASGIALWPIVVGHAVMGSWCIVSLKARHP